MKKHGKQIFLKTQKLLRRILLGYLQIFRLDFSRFYWNFFKTYIYVLGNSPRIPLGMSKIAMASSRNVCQLPLLIKISSGICSWNYSGLFIGFRPEILTGSFPEILPSISTAIGVGVFPRNMLQTLFIIFFIKHIICEFHRTLPEIATGIIQRFQFFKNYTMNSCWYSL